MYMIGEFYFVSQDISCPASDKIVLINIKILYNFAQICYNCLRMTLWMQGAKNDYYKQSALQLRDEQDKSLS